MKVKELALAIALVAVATVPTAAVADGSPAVAPQNTADGAKAGSDPKTQAPQEANNKLPGQPAAPAPSQPAPANPPATPSK